MRVLIFIFFFLGFFIFYSFTPLQSNKERQSLNDIPVVSGPDIDKNRFSLFNIITREFYNPNKINTLKNKEKFHKKSSLKQRNNSSKNKPYIRGFAKNNKSSVFRKPVGSERHFSHESYRAYEKEDSFYARSINFIKPTGSVKSHSVKHEKKPKKIVSLKSIVSGSFETSPEGSIKSNKIKSNNLPKYYQGIYINSYTAKKASIFYPLLRRAHDHGINVLVVDVQPLLPTKEFMEYTSNKGFHLVSRVVVFPGGLKTYPPSEARMKKVYKSIKNSIEIGFNEIQLDYIRFSDRAHQKHFSLKRRYECIEKILQKVSLIIKSYDIPFGADLFGRIAFNYNDRIGQRLELFSKYTDTIYPMLYPSHFYGMPQRIKDPYGTIKDGIQNSKKRVKEKSRIIAYIQAFKQSIIPSGLSYQNYIYKQILAAEASGGSGYIAWNSRNRYLTFFKALREHSGVSKNKSLLGNVL